MSVKKSGQSEDIDELEGRMKKLEDLVKRMSKKLDGHATHLKSLEANWIDLANTVDALASSLGEIPTTGSSKTLGISFGEAIGTLAMEHGRLVDSFDGLKKHTKTKIGIVETALQRNMDDMHRVTENANLTPMELTLLKIVRVLLEKK